MQREAERHQIFSPDCSIIKETSVIYGRSLQCQLEFLKVKFKTEQINVCVFFSLYIARNKALLQETYQLHGANSDPLFHHVVDYLLIIALNREFYVLFILRSESYSFKLCGIIYLRLEKNLKYLWERKRQNTQEYVFSFFGVLLIPSCTLHKTCIVSPSVKRKSRPSTLSALGVGVTFPHFLLFLCSSTSRVLARADNVSDNSLSGLFSRKSD